eukprot:c26492_g2_i1 orf=456-1499(-)
MAAELPVFGVPWPDLNDGIFYKDVVPPEFANCTLLEYYSSRYKDSASRHGWLWRINNGQITVDKMVVTSPNAVIRSGSILIYHRLPWKEPFAPFKLQILYEDNDILAVNKPVGLQVLPGGVFQQRTVLSQLQWRSTDRDHNSRSYLRSDRELSLFVPSPVHRLGRGTSGVLLCAISQIAKSKLAADFAFDSFASSRCIMAKRHISKTYRALVAGIISINEVEILTGRPHQIRIHLAYLGHPLLGDPLYVSGGKPRENLCAQFLDTNQEQGDLADDGGFQKPVHAVPGDCGYQLHAHRLRFSHPVSDKEMEIIATLPPSLCTPDEVLTVQTRYSVWNKRKVNRLPPSG